MTVSDCVLGSHTLSVDDARHTISVKNTTAAAAAISNGVNQLRAISSLCNAANFDVSCTDEPIDKRRTFGDATDSAILRFAETVEDGGVAYFRACWRRTFELAFNSKNKFMIRCFTIGRPEALGKTLTAQDAAQFQNTDL